jgi:hypothetical protein
MVKRDLSLVIMRSVTKLLAILLFLIPLIFLWGYIFGGWPLGAGDIIPIAFAIFAPFAGVAFWRDGNVKRMEYVESLRMGARDVSVIELDDDAQSEKPLLPIILILLMSTSWYVVFPIVWLLLLGIVLPFINTGFDIQDMFLLFALWLVLGGVAIGFTGIAVYQRIEVTEQALIMQKGIIRSKITWEQALLFAYIAKNKEYELSSKHAILRWSRSYSGLGFTSRPVEKQAYEHLIDAMLVYIQQRTDLPLRDLR